MFDILRRKKEYDIKTLSIDRVLNKEHFYGKIIQKISTKKLVSDPFLIWVKIPKQPLHAGNSFKNKMF